MLPIPEEELVARLSARDPTAMTLFYDHYGKMLYTVLQRIVHDEALAEDALQECLVKIWFSFPSYDPSKGRLFTWVLNLCRHVAIDQLRTRRYRERQRTQPLDDTATSQMPAVATFQPEHIGVRELLFLLAPRDRVLLELLYFDGFTHSEAADHLAIPLGTLKTRVRTALRLLVKFTQDHHLVSN